VSTDFGLLRLGSLVILSRVRTCQWVHGLGPGSVVVRVAALGSGRKWDAEQTILQRICMSRIKIMCSCIDWVLAQLCSSVDIDVVP